MTKHTFRKRAFSMTKLISSLRSPDPENAEALWEKSLGEQCARFYGQHAIRQGALENATLVPTRGMRDLLTGTASAGGDLVATSLEAAADSVRPVTVLERAGAERLEVAGDNLALPSFEAASAGWVSENATFPALGTTVKSVDATPKMAAARLAFSRRLKSLGNDIEAAVVAEVGRAVGAVIEQGAIAGSGSSNEPLGLEALPSRLTKTFSAATPTSDELADMLEKLGDNDADLNKVAFLLHPSDAARLMKARVDASSGSLVLNDFKIHGLPAFVSTNITEGKVIALDPSFVKIVYFGAASLIVDPFRGGISGETHIQILNSMDVVCTYQSAVCVGSA